MIGFIGLGQLGLPIASNLLERGHLLRIYNRTASKVDPLLTRGAERAERPIDAVTPGGIVVSLLWDDASVQSIVTSEGFLDRLGPGGVHLSMSSISPEGARRLAALHAAKGSVYLDAPVFGRPEAAAARKLWIPIAGDRAAQARVKPLLEAMGAQGVFDFGPDVGAATVVKLVGNFLIGAAARSLGEGVMLAESQGVDPHAIVHMLTTTLFPAPIYQSYGKMIADKTVPFGPGAILKKDLGNLHALASATGTSMPIADRLYEIFTRA